MIKSLRAAFTGGAGSGGAGENASGSGGSSVAEAISRRLDTATQLSGLLWKRDTSGSESWAQRLFVIKDGFLIYYPPPPVGSAEAEGGSSGRGFNMHPKGIVPLDGVEVETVRAGPKQLSALTAAIRLTHPSFGTKAMLLCARDDAERERWVTALTAASYITYGRAVAAAAELEAAKRELDEAAARLAATEATLARKQEQVIKLMAAARGLNSGTSGLASPPPSIAPAADAPAALHATHAAPAAPADAAAAMAMLQRQFSTQVASPPLPPPHHHEVAPPPPFVEEEAGAADSDAE